LPIRSQGGDQIQSYANCRNPTGTAGRNGSKVAIDAGKQEPFENGGSGVSRRAAPADLRSVTVV